MAKLYDAYEGDDPIQSERFAEMPFDKLIDKLGLLSSDRKAPLSGWPPTFCRDPAQPESDDGRSAAGVIIKAEKSDVTNLSGWESGWYIVPLFPNEVRKRLGL